MDAAPSTYARPFIPVLLSLMGGIILAVHLPGMLLPAAILSAASAAAMVTCILRRSGSRVLPYLLFLGLGYVSIHPWIAPRFPDHHVIHLADGPRYHIAGHVYSRPRQQVHRTRFVLQVQHISDGRTKRPATGMLRVTIAGEHLKVQRGDRIELQSRIRSIRNFNNPGGFDYRRYMAFQKVWGTAYSSAEKLHVLQRRAAAGPAVILDEVRSRVDALIDQSRPGPQRDVLRALILGDRSRIPPDLREAFHRTGIGHLLAISGLHIGIVAGAAFSVLVILLSRIEILLWHAWVRKAAAIGAFIPALAYALLAGMSPSTQRALAMVGMFLLTFLLQREQDSVNTLAVAALLILLFDPTALYSISFQLSFTAVFFIIVGLSRLQRPPTAAGSSTALGSRLGRKLAGFCIVTLAATIGTLPLIMAYFQQVSLIGLISNLVFVPLVGFGVVPLGLLSVFISGIFPPAAAWGMQAAGSLLAWAVDGIELFADLPFAAVNTFVPSVFEIGCYYLLLAAVLILLRQTRGADNQSTTGPAGGEAAAAGNGARRGIRSLWPRRRSRWAVALLLLAVAGGLADTAYWFHQRFLRSDLRVTVIDVGQGSAALLELPNGSCMLADGGGFADNAIFDVGQRVLAPLLRRKKILTVETLILTHPNSDHLNGLIYIADRFGVQQIWTNGEQRKTLGYRQLQQVLQRRGIRQIPYSQLPRSQVVAGTRLEVLYPPIDFLARKEKERWRDTNANSLAFAVGVGAVRFLFTGDITARAEKELVSLAGNRVNTAVLVAPHHGSRTSSSKALIEAVAPDFVVVSCGWQNRFGFPHPEVLRRYRKQQAQVYRTDLNGAVELATDGRQLQITPMIGR